MSVLQRKELEASPLADLHAIAAELGVEGFRGMRKADLIKAILSEQDDGDAETPVEVDTDATADQPEELEPEPESEPEPEDAEPEEVPDPVEEEPEDEQPPSDEAIASGVLDILPNGSGFVRTAGDGQSPDDIYISPAQIRRC